MFTQQTRILQACTEENTVADISTDLILDSAAASQLVAVTDGDYNGGLKEKGIPSLQGVRTQRENTFINIC